MALTLDEFALILRLQDVYWTSEGRLSVDAVIVAVCAGFLIILGFSPTGTGNAGLTGGAAAAAVDVARQTRGLLRPDRGKAPPAERERRRAIGGGSAAGAGSG